MQLPDQVCGQIFLCSIYILLHFHLLTFNNSSHPSALFPTTPQGYNFCTPTPALFPSLCLGCCSRRREAFAVRFTLVQVEGFSDLARRWRSWKQANQKFGRKGPGTKPATKLGGGLSSPSIKFFLKEGCLTYIPRMGRCPPRSFWHRVARLLSSTPGRFWECDTGRESTDKITSGFYHRDFENSSSLMSSQKLCCGNAKWLLLNL